MEKARHFHGMLVTTLVVCLASFFLRRAPTALEWGSMAGGLIAGLLLPIPGETLQRYNRWQAANPLATAVRMSIGMLITVVVWLVVLFFTDVDIMRAIIGFGIAYAVGIVVWAGRMLYR